MPTIVLASGTQWFVPFDCQTATIEAIGAGPSGLLNHGGSYAKSTGVSLTPGTLAGIQIPAGGGGGDAWFNKDNSIRYTPDQLSWSGTQFVARDNTSNVIVSPDGINWTQKPGARTIITNLSGIIKVTSYGSNIVAIGQDGNTQILKIAYSGDGGNTWAEATLPTSQYESTALYVAGDGFVLQTQTAAGANSWRQFTSSSGSNWSQTLTYTLPGSGASTSPFVIYAGYNKSFFITSTNEYVSIGDAFVPSGGATANAKTFGITTIRGTTQTLITSAVMKIASDGFRSVAFGNGVWVAVGTGGQVSTSATPSTNTNDWTIRNSGTFESFNDIVFDGTKFIAAATNNKVFTSTNGQSWQSYNTPFLGGFGFTFQLVLSGSQVYAYGSSQGIAKTTNSGANWTYLISGTGAPVNANQGVKAAGGVITPTSQSINSVYTNSAGNFYQGGTSAQGFICCGLVGIPGAGGGAGPNGAGGNGGTSYSGGGGGANGGGAGQNGVFPNGGNGGISRPRPLDPNYPLGYPGGVGGTNALPNGGNGTNGSGGGGGRYNASGNGGNGGNGSLDTIWTDFANTTYGVGSGGGGIEGQTGFSVGNAGGPGGGGRGTLGQGIIVITYTPAPVSGTYSQPVTSSQVIYIPAGTTTIVAEAIGPGSKGGSSAGAGGGGGGAYAKSSATSGFTAGGAGYASVPASSDFGLTADTWFRYTASNPPDTTTFPTLISQGVLAKGASSATGGSSGSSLGSLLVYSGGNGGASTPTRQKGGGGGAAAGPLGVGLAGGSGRNNSGTGGGGGGGGTSGPPAPGNLATAGVTPTGTTGGQGGTSSGGQAGGVGGNLASPAGAGTNGSGGGGGAGSTTNATLANGANGSTLPVVAASGQVAWTIGGVVYGPGSGGGGAGATTSDRTFVGGNGGQYGGGGGAGGGSAVGGNGGNGGQGLLILTYTIVAASSNTSKFFAILKRR
jgi:hypothetical protein